MIADNHAPLCVLLAEDEMMISIMLEDRLEQAGYRVLAAASLERALKLARKESIDVAVLDINLDGEQSFPVADALRHRGIAFVFASGYGVEGIPQKYRDEKILQKPYDTNALLSILSSLSIERSAADHAG